MLSLRLAAKTERVLTLDDGKAHYILEIMKHITWPNEDQLTHFNIALLGQDKNLLNALNNKVSRIIRGKSILITQLSHLNKTDHGFEIIFVNRNKLSLIADINKKQGNTLIISDGKTNNKNLMVGLFVAGKTITLTVNRENLMKRGFKISDQLLDFAGTKADLKEQLKDRKSALNKVLSDAKTQEEQLLKLTKALTKNKRELQQIQTDLVKQNSLLVDAQTQRNKLKNSEQSIKLELTHKKNELLKQQILITEKEEETKKQQQKLQQLNLAIEQNENRLSQQINKLKQQSEIIERKEEKISGQRKFLYLSIAVTFVILLLSFLVLRISYLRKQVNIELAHLNEQLYEHATTDDMTKLFNRRHFLELAQRELKQLQRTKSMGAVLMIDIDHFKKINDNHGHAAGDHALIKVANVLKSNLRDYDIVGRVGGEEFAMFLPNCQIDIATQIAERIRKEMADLAILFQQVPIKLTISIGVTAKLADESSIDNMLYRADKALYQAKNSGRNAVVLL
ncbi:MAG: DUF4154 domain-containing protein [Colwellia sp.]|nr:DUF4154 domain-containing protein [Colwellia sp.]